MRTPWAARSPARRPIFLRFVVPILYLLALTGAVIAARDRAVVDVRSVELSQAPARTVSAAAARSVRATIFRPTAPERVARHRARRLALVAPVRNMTPVISRSASRSALVPSAESTPFVLRIASITTPATMQAAINACDGPVAIDWSADPRRWGVHPMEIAEHDYCGGAAFTSLATQRQVRVVGGGLSGLYVVDGLRRFVPSGASASELDGLGDIALQTCVSDGMILVGLDRIG